MTAAVESLLGGRPPRLSGHRFSSSVMRVVRFVTCVAACLALTATVAPDDGKLTLNEFKSGAKQKS